MLLLLAVWMLVLGYALVYVGYSGFSSKTVTFKDAFLGPS